MLYYRIYLIYTLIQQQRTAAFSKESVTVTLVNNMSLNEGNNYYCPVQQQQVEKIIIKTEASDDDQCLEPKGENSLLLISAKLKCEDGQNDDAGCGPSSEFCNFENTLAAPFPIKQENEDLSTSALKEEIDIDDHKPGWELLTGSRDSRGIFKGGLDQCEPVQESEALQARSSESKSEGELKYNCAHCLFKTNRSNFIKHYKCKHSKDAKVFKCEECSFETRYKYDLLNHCKHKHSKDAEMFKCGECSYETKNKNALPNHYKIKHSEDADVYRCQECSYKTKTKGHFKEHYKLKHSKDAEVYQCRECSYETKCKSNLTQHFKYKHSKNADVYKCQECSYKTKNKSDLSRHCKCKHSKHANMYKCHECSYETGIKHYLIQHYKRQHSKDADVYKCAECQYETKTKRSLVRHLKSSIHSIRRS